MITVSIQAFFLLAIGFDSMVFPTWFFQPLGLASIAFTFGGGFDKSFHWTKPAAAARPVSPGATTVFRSGANPTSHGFFDFNLANSELRRVTSSRKLDIAFPVAA